MILLAFTIFTGIKCAKLPCLTVHATFLVLPTTFIGKMKAMWLHKVNVLKMLV